MWNWRPLLCLFMLTIAVSLPRDQRTTEREAIAALEAKLDREAAEDTFSGTVVSAKHGREILAQSYNRADRARGELNTLSTSLNIGSINKTLTAVTTLRLVQ